MDKDKCRTNIIINSTNFNIVTKLPRLLNIYFLAIFYLFHKHIQTIFKYNFSQYQNIYVKYSHCGYIHCNVFRNLEVIK